jgi:hypothetical protein
VGAWVWDASAVANGAEEPVNDQFWDGPWYRVRTGAFEVSFLPGDEDVEMVCNVDVFVDLPDGSRWSATVFTLAEVERLMDLWATTGEALGGRYFWCSDGLIVRERGVSAMVAVLTGLLGSGDFRQVLRQIDDLE